VSTRKAASHGTGNETARPRWPGVVDAWLACVPGSPPQQAHPTGCCGCAARSPRSTRGRVRPRRHVSQPACRAGAASASVPHSLSLLASGVNGAPPHSPTLPLPRPWLPPGTRATRLVPYPCRFPAGPVAAARPRRMGHGRMDMDRWVGGRPDAGRDGDWGVAPGDGSARPARSLAYASGLIRDVGGRACLPSAAATHAGPGWIGRLTSLSLSLRSVLLTLLR